MSPSEGSRFNPRKFIRRLFARPVDERTREILDTLRTVSYFSELSKRTLHTLADYVHVRDYRPQEFIYYDGDPGIGLYVIGHGRVALMLEEADGAVHELRAAGEGEMFGELAVLAGARRMETAQAVEDTRVLGLFRPDFLTLIKRHPRAGADLLMAFTRYLAARDVAVIRLMSQQDGRLAALRLFDGVSRAEDIIRDDSLSTLNG